MAERPTQQFARKKENLSDKTYPTGFPKKLSNTDNFNPDELIVTLSQSYENRRAVQAFEWEAIRLGGLSGMLHRETIT